MEFTKPKNMKYPPFEGFIGDITYRVFLRTVGANIIAKNYCLHHLKELKNDQDIDPDDVFVRWGAVRNGDKYPCWRCRIEGYYEWKEKQESEEQG